MEGNTETNLTMSGADVILKVLEEQGVEVIFGYPGGAIYQFMIHCLSQIV